MSIHIVVHNAKAEDAYNSYRYLYENLNDMYPGKVQEHYNGQLLIVDNGTIEISFRSGYFTNLAGIRPNYYYTDDISEYVSDILKQSANKCNGKEVTCLDDIIQLIDWYMDLFDQIDNWLESR